MLVIDIFSLVYLFQYSFSVIFSRCSFILEASFASFVCKDYQLSVIIIFCQHCLFSFFLFFHCYLFWKVVVLLRISFVEISIC